MNIISLVNQKGGVAKTTTAVCLSSLLAEIGKKVLVIDMDAQGNLTENFGINGDELNNTIYEVLTKELPLNEAIHSTEFGVDIVPANISLANTELDISNKMSRETLLKRAFKVANLSYDFVILDLPPSLGLITLNALALSNYVLIPVDAGVYSLSGINQLIKIMKMVKDNDLNEEIDVLGVLLTKADDRINVTKEMRETLEEIFEDKLFTTYIHHNSKIIEAQRDAKPINFFDKNSRGYKEYKELAKEVIERVK